MGHPILSIWGVDVIYYGMDVADYIDNDFGPVEDDLEAEVLSQPGPRPQCPETFRTQLADWSTPGCPIPPA